MGKIKREKILFDTDIGSDIDDAVCLAYLLMKKECDLLGITTVTGESEKRAMMADAMCKAAGRQIPIFAGADMPLMIPQRQKLAPQAEKLTAYHHAEYRCEGNAIGFMRDIIYKNPGEVTLLAVGPLTNVALLFASDKNIASMLKRLVIMCGNFGFDEAVKTGTGAADKVNKAPSACRPEWNARVDPHATAIVYRAPVKVHRSVGLDVTTKVKMKKEDVARRFNHDLLRIVADFAQVWFARTETLTFHDPLAAACIFNDNVCNFVRGSVTTDYTDGDEAGITLWEALPESGAHEAASRVDCDEFFNEYFSVF